MLKLTQNRRKAVSLLVATECVSVTTEDTVDIWSNIITLVVTLS